MFDLRRHGNRNYGSPHNAVKSMRSSQGKMEKSLLRYPYLILNMSLIIYIYLKHISIITIVLVLLCAYMLCTSYHGPLFLLAFSYPLVLGYSLTRELVVSHLPFSPFECTGSSPIVSQNPSFKCHVEIIGR
jgi:hypothetical protein